jgi:hypothetical protein
VKRLALAIALLLTLVACGSKKDGGPSSLASSGKTTTTTGASGSSSGPSTTSVGGSSKTSPGGGTTGTTAAPGSSPSTTGTTTPIQPTGKLDKSCVRKGKAGDLQTFTVHTAPKDAVGYTSKYSDGSTKFTKPAYDEGDGYGNADDQGNFTAIWHVPDIAPNGTATLSWVARGKFQTSMTFTVVSATGHC